MRLDDLRPTQNTEDRRGGFSPGTMVGGGGIGLIGLVIVCALLGIDPSQVLNGMGALPSDQATQGSGGPRADDAAYEFSRKIVGSAEDVWAPILRAKGVGFQPATLTVYDYVTPTGCGTGQASAGPFYCPSDGHIYLDLAFFDELGSRFGAPGDFARAYVIAHEYGHRIQDLLGTMERHRPGERGANSDSVRIELQADCYAGVWANRANKQFKILQDGDVEAGLRAAAAVGDDTLEKEHQGYAVPDSFTHGTSAQRTNWFRRGLADGNVEACDTFSAAAL